VRKWFASRGLPIPAAYFLFGNENYGTWEIGHMTGGMYAAQLREFVPPVRSAYPEARILAIGEFESGALRQEYTSPWRSVVLEQAAGLFDTLVVTRYSREADSLTLPGSMAWVADKVADKTADLQRQAQSIRDAKLSCTMGIVEWNYWTIASHNDHAGFYEPNDIRHCLYAAGYLNAFCRMGEIMEVANYYSLVNTMGMIHVHDGRVRFSDVVKVFNLYAPALPGETLELEVVAPALTEKSRVVDANVLRKGDDLYGFLINYSASETAEVSLEGLGAVCEARGLSARAILEPVIEFVPAVTGAMVTLPPMSLVRVRCQMA
jgi:alpha-L-arabinofuranosidase